MQSTNHISKIIGNYRETFMPMCYIVDHHQEEIQNTFNMKKSVLQKATPKRRHGIVDLLPTTPTALMTNIFVAMSNVKYVCKFHNILSQSIRRSMGRYVSNCIYRIRPKNHSSRINTHNYKSFYLHNKTEILKITDIYLGSFLYDYIVR